MAKPKTLQKTYEGWETLNDIVDDVDFFIDNLDAPLEFTGRIILRIEYIPSEEDKRN